MFYTPNYCCHCGEKIERAHTSLTDSGRFCDVCKEDFRSLEWSPKIFAILMSIVGLFGVGTLLLSGEKPANNISKQLSAGNSNQNRTVAVRPTVAANNANLQVSANVYKPSANKETPPVRQDLIAKNAPPDSVKENSATELTYFCGALTKKGTPCSRRVKGGGRCWQHKGQNAVLPPEKLVASQ